MSDRRNALRVSLLLLAVVAAAAGGTACVERPFVWVGDLPISAEGQNAIGVRDTLLVVIRNQPTMSGEFVVREDGAYLQPTLGNVPVAGKDPATVAAELKIRLKDILAEPDVSVVILKTAPARVSVVGEVKTPGTYELTRDRGLITALAAAGWLTDFARRDRVFVVRPRTSSSSEAERVRFRTAELTGAEPHAVRFRLRDGDVVVVE